MPEKPRAAARDRLALIPEGAFSYPIDRPGPTRWFGFLLLPEFTLLAFSSAIDPLRIANQLAGKPLYGWLVLSEDGQPVPASAGLEISAQAGLEALDPGVHLFVCSGNRGTEVATDRALAAIRKHSRFGGAVGGICTGAATLARAGLLDGKRFTLHWENQPGFTEAFPDLEPSSTRVERDGTLLTCGGGSAATDMMVDIIAADYGRDFAIAVADMCLNAPAPAPDREQRSSIAKAISSRNARLLHVLRSMYAHIEEPLTLDGLAENAGISRRQLERLFRLFLKESPATTYRNIRLDRAHSLLAETDMSVMEIALATGFSDVALLARHYKARFGQTPYGKRGKK
ncbi:MULTISPECIES: GlxA family transcriptional regulator [Marinovum]|uniref:GlxA family transcriptional regulator n=1 Tax=Marinovum TaxID=367771 RepID=UPI00237A1EFF|nr:GlxA family transcriptional regulator [Marinovum sp. PR37]MDD9743894.1 GlxA family transcriptional regulator [Marinovum sp. PR37]